MNKKEYRGKYWAKKEYAESRLNEEQGFITPEERGWYKAVKSLCLESIKDLDQLINSVQQKQLEVDSVYLKQRIAEKEKKLIDEIYNKLGNTIGDDVLEIAKAIRDSK
ncbi:MAG: hypothetical protein KAS32_04090 [Candidatus Peribacteraceae bacterium]|nr:hypothetical protein [Candidatus Peribacteraceae bacterium]